MKGNNNPCLQRKELPPETYYFINKENNLLFFDTCYENCATCLKHGNSEMHNFLTCKEKLYIIKVFVLKFVLINFINIKMNVFLIVHFFMIKQKNVQMFVQKIQH